jgi:hypothetical protein
MATETLEQVENEVKTELKKPKVDLSTITYIEQNICKPEGTKFVIAKSIVPGKFYRVNFYKESQGQKECVVRNWHLFYSRFIEIINPHGVLEILDRTVESSAKSGETLQARY